MRLSQVPRVKITTLDKSRLMGVATRYEQAAGVYSEAARETHKPTAYKLIDRAQKTRQRATEELIQWSTHRLANVEPGYPTGSNYPRMKKLYDASWDFRKLGPGGCALAAARTIRAVVKRGWL